jgi:hypothetical protein
LLLLGACTRSASSPLAIPSLQPTPSPTPAAVPYPLALASTWIYDYRAYSASQQAAWIVTETIIKSDQQIVLLIATVQRTARLIDGQPDQSLPNIPKDETFWYILRGGELYRQTGHLNPSDLSQNTSLELFFPPESVPCWYLAESLGPLQKGESGCRTVNTYLPSYETVSGSFKNCLELITPFLSGNELAIFCPHIGFVAGKYEHLGDVFGYEFKLLGYSLPEP